MIRSALFALLAAAGASHAALPRVVIEAPLMPLSAPAFVAAPAGAALSEAPRFLGAPALSAAPAALSVAPAFAAPAALAAPAAALAPLPPAAARAPARAAAGAASVPEGPRAIDALRANAPLADKLSEAAGSAEDSARALEANFNAAASLGADVSGNDGPVSPSERPGAHAALLARLLEHATIDDDGVPERRAALTRAFERMLETPTARALAERFIADGVPAVVRFETVEGSRISEVNGRKIFYAPRAFTEWKTDHVEVRMNPDYLAADAEFQQQDLPPTLAHELLGHGLWYSRAARENALQAFHHHDLNETNARLVGWLVDFELDQRFEESGAWSYLQDPAAFLNHLKLRLPYYALTWSTAELARPRETLEERSQVAKAKRESLRAQLINHESWNAVIEFFVQRRDISESRLNALRGYMTDTARGYRDEIDVMDALIAEVDATVGRMNAEPDRSSERYLKSAATHPLFADLKNETDENTRRLVEQVSRTPAKIGDESAATVKAREDHWRGQLTFDQLVEMYRRDRERHPEHWRS
jgi:hypothetical protein